MRSTVSCTTLFCCEDRLRNNIFVDIPWQQTTVGLLLPAGNTVSAVPPTQQTVLKQTPTMTVQIAYIFLSFVTSWTCFKLTMHHIYHVHVYCSNSTPIPTSFPNFKWPPSPDISEWFKSKAHTVYYSIKYSQPAFIRLEIQYI